VYLTRTASNTRIFLGDIQLRSVFFFLKKKNDSIGRCEGGLILLFCVTVVYGRLFCVIVVYGENKDNSRLFGTLIYIYIYIMRTPCSSY
jgi:hypothetical protein